jgi:hypothetical protein
LVKNDLSPALILERGEDTQLLSAGLAQEKLRDSRLPSALREPAERLADRLVLRRRVKLLERLDVDPDRLQRGADRLGVVVDTDQVLRELVERRPMLSTLTPAVAAATANDAMSSAAAPVLSERS